MYNQLISEQQSILNKLQKKSRFLSIARIFLFAGSVYLFYLMMYHRENSYGWWALLFIVLFVLCVNIYLKVQSKIKYHSVLKQINQDEIDFLKGEKKFDEGKEFINPQHPFSYDLDLFGLQSIFQYINRTGTSLGKKQLAKDLQSINSEQKIKLRQEVIKELSENLAFRQKFQALALLANTDNQKDLAIKKWTESPIEKPHKAIKYLFIIVPILFFISVIGLFFELPFTSPRLSIFLFSLNLFLAGSLTKLITKEIGKSDQIANSLQQYSHMIEVFSSTAFTSDELNKLQKELNEKQATLAVKQLANIFEKLNTIANLFVFIALNGTIQYHFWVYKQLIQWKKNYKNDLWQWIEVIGKIESYNSFANYAYNHSTYTYPEITTNEITFHALGHPLINEKKRIKNSIDFTDKQFYILTGSNMSGKSTFLRTIGINLVLGYAGAPIDCLSAKITPTPLWVSMRLTDSLSDSESYFYAEVKRLQKIVEEASQQPIFILLDEILKGTNSDDKKSGTIGVIEKLQKFNVKGMLATHDLEVCAISKKYEQVMANKRFEVEIIEDELHFDYLLKDGICENKNATFIMKKMQII